MKKFNIKILCLIMAIVMGLMLFSGCGKQDDKGKTGKVTQNTNDNNGNKKLSVCASFYAMYDLTKKVGGDKINLVNLVPSGVEPHDWEPTPKDIANLEKADLLICNGTGMEGWLDKISGSLDNDKLVIVDTSKDIKLLDGHEEDENLKYDPHVWLNPMNAKKQMEIIKDALVKADETNKDYYEKNYEEYAKQLDELDQEYKDAVATFTKKEIIVSHQAFGYLCDAYGLKQTPIEGLTADAEPSPAKMAEIVKFAKEHDVKYIFFEELVSPKVAETIAQEVGAQTEVLNPLEGLEDDDIKAGKEYISVMKENLEVLKKALQ